MELLNQDNIHQRVIEDVVLEARQRVWIATANLKDMHIKNRRGYKPILAKFEQMARNGVTFRVIHSDTPTKNFRNSLDDYPYLIKHMELQICIRNHWKIVLVDGRWAYFGSANFTGAGLGAKSPNRRNLEVGALLQNEKEVNKLESMFDQFWMGDHCSNCGLRKICPDPIT